MLSIYGKTPNAMYMHETKLKAVDTIGNYSKYLLAQNLTW